MTAEILVPDALRALRRWSHFDLVPLAGREKPAKVPTRKVNAVESWMTYDEAAASLGRHAGFAFLLGDGWAGIDIDGADLDPEFSRTVIECCRGAYVEPSISGAGLHVIGRSDRLGFEIDFRQSPPKITPWETARFFVFLGTGEGDPTRDVSLVIDQLAPRREFQPTGPRRGYEHAAQTGDYDLLIQAMGSENGERFGALFRGDASAYGNDHSRADQALVTMLAFWCNFDGARVDRLFRQSGLYRTKWDAPSYRGATLRKAGM